MTRSGERAQGIAQFMPGTAAERNLLNPFDPIQALPKSAEFLRELRRDGRISNAKLAERVGLPIVATGNVHYHLRERHRLQDAMVALKHHTTLEGSHTVRRSNSEFYLRSPQQAAAAFAAYPQAVANTQRIADRCAAFDLSRRDALGYDFPDFSRGEGETAATADEVLASDRSTSWFFRTGPAE